MIRGKTIQVYLPDGNPKSIKICDINISFVKGIFIPRSKLQDIEKYENISKQGIYFLISNRNESLRPNVYIGETENILIRLKQHDNPQKEWDYAICFISDKNNLNKAHYKFLEHRCFKLASEAEICILDNSILPTQSQISRQDQDLVSYFFDDLKIILGNLGYQIFDKIKEGSTKELFYCRGKGIEAKGILTEEGFLVFADSEATIELVPSAEVSWIQRIRETLKEDQIWKEENGKLVFLEDFYFNSPSTASTVILGRYSNGWDTWKNDFGVTLDEIKRQHQ